MHLTSAEISIVKKLTAYHAFKFHVEADDLFQDILLKLTSKEGIFTEREAKFGTWCSYIIKNHCIDHVRKQRMKLYSIDHCRRSIPFDMAFQERQHIAQIFFRVRREWPERRRMYTRILWLLMTGYKLREISEDTGVNINNVKTVIHRIRKILPETKLNKAA